MQHSEQFLTNCSISLSINDHQAFFHQDFQSIDSLMDLEKFFDFRFWHIFGVKVLDQIYIKSPSFVKQFETFRKHFSILVQFFQFPIRILFIIISIASLSVPCRHQFQSISFSNVAIATATKSSSSSLNLKRDIASAWPIS